MKYGNKKINFERKRQFFVGYKFLTKGEVPQFFNSFVTSCISSHILKKLSNAHSWVKSIKSKQMGFLCNIDEQIRIVEKKAYGIKSSQWKLKEIPRKSW